MTEPVIINEDLNDESLSQVQNLLTEFINNPSSENPVFHKLQEHFQNQSDSSVQDQLSTMQETLASQGQKYKICIFDKGQIKFPEKEEEKRFLDSVSGCMLNNEIQINEPTSSNVPQNGNSVEDKNTKSEVKKEYTSNVPTLDELLWLKEAPYKSRVDEVPNIEIDHDPEPSPPSPNNGNDDSLDCDVMNKLLDYYRQFNERQLGLASDKETPLYRPNPEKPVGIICDDIVKEAVMRVNQKQEDGITIKEPTITDYDSEEERKYQEEKLKEEKEDEEEDENYYYDEDQEEWKMEDLPWKAKKNYEDEWIFGANFIEKALQKTIDEGKRTKKVSNRTWDRKDIVRLVEMLSKKQEQRKAEREWTGNLVYTDYRDDLLYKLEDIDQHKRRENDSLFTQLKSEPGTDKDNFELMKMVSENSIKFRQDHRVYPNNRKIYYGGDELTIVMEYITDIFSFINFDWFWFIYDRTIAKIFYKLFGKWYDSYRQLGANGGIAVGDAGNSVWYRIAKKLNEFDWLSRWLPAGLQFGVTGKPIYRQVQYEETEVEDWHQRFLRETEDTNSVTNRSRRCRNTISREAVFPTFDETDTKPEIETESIEEIEEASVVIEVENEEFMEAENEFSEIFIEAVTEFQPPEPGQIYKDLPNGRTVLNLGPPVYEEQFLKTKQDIQGLSDD